MAWLHLGGSRPRGRGVEKKVLGRALQHVGARLGPCRRGYESDDQITLQAINRSSGGLSLRRRWGYYHDVGGFAGFGVLFGNRCVKGSHSLKHIIFSDEINKPPRQILIHILRKGVLNIFHTRLVTVQRDAKDDREGCGAEAVFLKDE